MHGDYQNSSLLMKMKPDTGDVPARPHKVQYYRSGRFSVTGISIFHIRDKEPDKNGHR